MDELLKIQEEALAKIAACADAKELNDLRVFYLGKKGPIQARNQLEDYGSQKKEKHLTGFK